MAILDMKKLFQELHLHGVAFIVVGGAAGMAHGMNYLTDDLDICYERKNMNYSALVKTLTPAHPKLRTRDGAIPFLFDEKTLKNGLNFTLETDWGSIDLMGEVPGVGNYQRILPQSVEFEFYGTPVKTIALDQLIQAKQTAGREKDRLHLLQLEAIRDSLRAQKKQP